MRQCSICEKKYSMVWRRLKLRGRFNPTSKSRKFPNIQWVRLASGKRVKACTKCIKSLGKKDK